MLNNDSFILLQLIKMQMADMQRSSDQQRMAFLYNQTAKVRRSAIATFILHETGKALVSTGNRLLAIA